MKEGSQGMSRRLVQGARRASRPERPTLRKRVAAVRYIPPFVRLVWGTHRGFTVSMMALRLLRAFVPVAILWVGKLIIDAVVAARAGAYDPARLWRLVGTEIALAL